MENTDASPITGVFRDPAKANLAIEELKRAGFGEEQIQSSVVSLLSAAGEQTPETTRIIVTVKADGNDKRAFGILFNNGANNADLPPGMVLKNGKIAESQAETVDLIPEPALEASFSNDSYFGELNEPGHSDEPIMGDTH